MEEEVREKRRLTPLLHSEGLEPRCGRRWVGFSLVCAACITVFYISAVGIPESAGAPGTFLGGCLHLRRATLSLAYGSHPSVQQRSAARSEMHVAARATGPPVLTENSRSLLRTIAVRTCRVQSAVADDESAAESMQREIPALRYIGDAQLMQVQPSMRRETVGTDACREMLVTLRDAMGHYGGIGIAAPQIGLWTRVFVFGIDESNERYPAAARIPFQVWINPEITWASAETNFMWEGCLSVPGLRGWVERPRAVRLRGLDEDGCEREVEMDGLAARIAQHELDHLDGILFTQRTPGTDFILPQASLEARDSWAEGWPSEGSRVTAAGALSDQM